MVGIARLNFDLFGSEIKNNIDNKTIRNGISKIIKIAFFVLGKLIDNQSSQNNLLVLLMTRSDLPEAALRERISQGLDFLNNAKETTIETILETTETITNNLSKASDRAITTTIEQTSQITDNLNEITRKAIENAIDSTITSWLNEHPLFFWLVTHPIWTSILFIFSLFLIVGLFEALGTLIKSIWIFIFKIPHKLIKKTTILTIKNLQNISYQILSKNSSQNKLELTKIHSQSERQQRIIQILDRLEELKQEQDRLLKEIAEMLKIEENNTQPKIENKQAE